METQFFTTLKKRLHLVFLWCLDRWMLSLASSFVALVFLIVFATNVFAVKEEHAYVFPLSAETSLWSAPEHAFVQDLSREAVLEDFTLDNSASLVLGSPSASAQSSSLVNPESTTTHDDVPVSKSPTQEEIPSASPASAPETDALSPALLFGTPAHAQESEGLSTSSSELLARCTVRGVPCRTMRFSGFSLGGALDASPLRSATLALSLGGHVSSPGTLSVSYNTDGQWKSAGEVSLSGEVSNASRGGYLQFSIPELSTWSQFDTLEVFVEFTPDAETVSEASTLYLDALWLDAQYERSDESDITSIPNVTSDLEEGDHSEFLHEETVRLGEKTIAFHDVPLAEEDGVSISVDRAISTGLRSAEYVVRVTNTSNEDFAPSLSLLGLPDTLALEEAWLFDKTRTVTRTLPVFGVTGYYCEDGWSLASTTGSAQCPSSGEERFCSARNEDGTNCIIEGDQIGTEEKEVVTPGFMPLTVRSYTDVSFLAELLGQYSTKEHVPADQVGVATVPLDHILAPGQSAYVRFRVTFPENTTGAFSLLASGDTGASALGTLSWDALWTKRIPVSVSAEYFDDRGVVAHIHLDADTPEFWEEVRQDGGDIRLVDDEAGIEIPFGITRFDSKKKIADIWGRVATLRSEASSTLYVYFGNPKAERTDDLLAVLTTDTPTPRSVVVGSDAGAINVDVTSFIDGGKVRVKNEAPVSVDKGEVRTLERVRSGEIIDATGPIAGHVSGGDATHAVVPLSFAGETFVIPETAGERELSLTAITDPTSVVIMDGGNVASSSPETIDLLPGEPSRLIVLPSGTITLVADAPLVVTLRAVDGPHPTVLSPIEAGASVGIMRDHLRIASLLDGSAYRVTCASGGIDEKDGRRAGTTFTSHACAGGDFSSADVFHILTEPHGMSMLSEETDSGVLLSTLPTNHLGRETILPFGTDALSIACLPEEESSWEVRKNDGTLVRAGNCLSNRTMLEKETIVPTLPDRVFPPGLSVHVVGTSSDPLLLVVREAVSGGELGKSQLLLGGEIESRGLTGAAQVVPHSAERVFPHDRREQDQDSEGNIIVHSNELLSEARDFSAKDFPEFHFRFSPRTSALLSGLRKALGMSPFTIEKLTLVHSTLGEIDADIEVLSREGEEWMVRVTPKTKGIRPGKYTLKMELNDNGEILTDAFDFYWGMIAVNTDQSEYGEDSDVLITAGALTNSGNTICDARLRAQITRPDGTKDDLDLPASGFCSGNNVTSVPDYFAQYHATSTGTYLLHVVEIDARGVLMNETQDTFVVTQDIPYTIKRTGPTRIYPLALYDMKIAVTAREDFTGSLVERIEKDFVVTDRGGAFLEDQGEYISATWGIGLKAGETQEFSYRFDAPNLSPYRFHLGPASLVVEGNALYTELRAWQIASDAAGQMMLFWDDGASTPAGWTCVSCSGGDPFSNRFAVGSTAYGTTSGATTHTHAASSSSVGTPVNTNGSAATAATEDNTVNATQLMAGSDHIHSFDAVIASTTTLPRSRTLRVIRSNTAGDVALPVGAIAIFDIASSSLSTNWYRYAPQDGYFLYGSTTVGTVLGSSTHTHVISSSTDNGVGTTHRQRAGGTQVTGANLSHQHTLSATTSLSNHEPPYLEVVIAKLTVATTAGPNGMIAMWNDTPATGWVSLSDVGGAFNGKYLKASTTYGGTGGALTHIPSALSATTSSSTNNTSARQQAPLGGLSSSHFHVVDLTFSETENLPPSMEVIFAKRSSGISAYTQEDFRFYTNINAITPTDPWPSGAQDLIENEAGTDVTTSIRPTQVLRLRMNMLSLNATTSVGAQDWKLQYSGSSDCATSLNWSDVAPMSSSTAAWRGYNNAGVTHNATLASYLLSTSTIAESYVEENNATTTPVEIPLAGRGEWDWTVQDNTATANTNYCFRMVKSDGSLLDVYANYPSILTNQTPDQSTQSAPFDNESVGTTTPTFKFTTTDPETNDLDYEIIIDDDPLFASPLMNYTSTNDPDLFSNVPNPTNRSPFAAGDTISYKATTALTASSTYWWRVRAIDPNGSNTYGSWSVSRSVTVDLSVGVARWHQTTAEQFQTDTHYGTNASSSVNNFVTLNSGSTTGTTTSSSIDFTQSATGTAWGLATWNYTNPGGAMIMHVEYYTSTGSWAYIPDAILSGNAAGFNASPINMIAVDPATYTIIRLRADFTGFGGSGPKLLDWTMNWEFIVNTPTLYKLFDNEKTGTTTPSFEFTTTDPQGDSLTYEFQWSTSPLFTSSTTRSSAAHAGFSDITMADTNPFNSGDRIRFTIQAGDALTASTTYWWRVRANDPGGSGTFSFYSSKRSFTVDLSVNTPNWFQTTQGQFDTDALTGAETFTGDAVRVATSTTEAMIAYGEGTVQTPRYRIWSGTAWGSELSAQSIGAQVKWMALKSSPLSGAYLMGTVGSDKDTNVQIYSGGAWGNISELSNNITNSDARGLDVAWETLSGDGMAVSCDGDNEPSYSTWNGTSWSTATSTIVLSATTSCEWIRLASDPASDEIILMERNTGSRFYAAVWNGSSWTSTTSLGQQEETNNEGMALEYEESGDQAIIVASTITPSLSFQSKFWNGSVWSSASTTALGDHPEFMELKRDKGTDKMALCYIDNDTDIGMMRWTGSAWTTGTTTEIEVTGNAKTGRAVDCEFENTSGRDGYIMIPYSDTTNGRSQFWNGTAFSGEASVGTVQDSTVVQARRTTDNLILAMFFDDVNRWYDFSYWNGTVWSPQQTLETSPSDTSAPHRETFMIAPKLPATTGTVYSPAIDFDDGVAPAWKDVSFSATSTGSSTVKVQVEYYTSTSSWALVPDTDLASNSTGFTSTTSLISILNLNTVTYNQIRLKATLTCIIGICPSLNDWRVRWSEGIDFSGTAKQSDFTSNVTSGTVSVAVNGTIQTGKTGTITGGVWSITNVTAFAGNTLTFFIDGAGDQNEANTVVRYAGPGNMAAIPLVERYLTIGSASTTGTTSPLTNGNLANYDNSVSSDEDIFFDVDAGNDVTVCSVSVTGCGGAGLFVNSGTYRPDSAGSGDVNTYHLRNDATTTADGNTFNVGGSWDNNFIFSANTGTVNFTATSSTRTVDSTGATTATFNTVTFGISGSATWNLSSNFTTSGDITVNFGTLSPGSATLSLDGNLTFGASGAFQKGTATTTFAGSVSKTWTDNTTAKQDLGLVNIDGTSKTLNLGSAVRATDITIGANDTLDVTTSNFEITVLGNWVNNNVFNARSGTTTFAGGAGASRTINPGTSAFSHLNFTGTSSWSFTTTGATTTGTVTIATGTLALPSGTLAVGGGFQNSGGAFTGGTTVKFSSSASGNKLQAGTSTWPEMLFTGSGAWSFQDANATTTSNVLITTGTLTLPTGTLVVPRLFDAQGGAFTANFGSTLKLTATSTTFNLRANGSSFAGLLFSGGGSWSMLDTNATTTGTFQITSGTTTLPSGTLAVGGSFLNADKFTHASGTVKMVSSVTGNSLTAGNSQFGNLEFRSATGGWTVTGNATTSGTFTLRSAGVFVQTSGTTLETRGAFSNQVGGASTTWSGVRLWLNSSSSYAINASTTGGDAYGILAIGVNTQISSWNSTSTSYEVVSSGSLYSQDHNSVDGELYIFGNYSRTSGTDYWNYATDFDGTTLTGGARRGVTVKFASSATSSFTGATLQIIGDTLASTTITNQGIGTYGIVLSGATINADSYVFRNLGNQGLQLLSSTTITALTHGDFELAVAGGTLITMSSTTIDKNQSLQISQVRFATSTAITGFNVTETGIATSSIRFISHYGNLAGEGYDIDLGPNSGNPGNVRWDDSNYIISISGTVFSDAGVTPMPSPVCDGVTQVVRVKVYGGGSYTAACSPGVATGTFTISGVSFTGDTVFTVYLDGAPTGARATLVTRSATANLTGINLYQNRAIVRHEDVYPLTITNMNAWDSGDDPDIPFLVSTSGTPTLTVRSDTEFWIWTGKAFTPGGNITINSGGSGNTYDGKFHLDNSAIFSGGAGETHTFGGSWQADSGSTFTGGGSAWIMNGTTTGKLITAVPAITFATLTASGTGGGWSMSGTFTVSSGLTMTAGTLSGTPTLTVALGGITGNGTIAMTGGTVTTQGTANFGGNTDWSFSGLTFGDGITVATTTKTGSSTITTNGVLTVTANTVLLASSSRWILLSSGTPITVSGTLSSQTSTFRYATTTAMNVRPLSYYRLELSPLGSGSPTYTILGGGTLSTTEDLVVGDSTNPVTVTANTNDPTLSVTRNVLIATSSTLIGSDSASFSVLGSWLTSGTYTHSAGTVTFTATTTGKTISASTSPFGALNFNSSSGGWTMLGNATATGAFSLTAATSFTLQSGATLEVDGVFTNAVGGSATTWTGSVLHLNSGTAYTINTKTTGADLYDLLRVGTATDVKLWNSDASSTLLLTTASIYSQNHASVNGSLYIWGDHARASGNEYWSAATDFDGTALGVPRQVNVRMASGTAFALTGGSLEVIGSSTASTTIDRQGSVGAFALRVAGGSTTMQYYQVRNADIDGLNISGSPTVGSLSDGDFEVAQGGGAGMTVAASVIDANPLKIAFRNRFATATAVSAFNVRATGSSTSAWRFSAHLASTTGGNLGGEFYDSDPGGDPGMLIWDDSAANVSITGVVYADSGVTPIGSPICDGFTPNVRLKVQGLGSYTTFCNSGTSQYTITNVIFNPGDTLTVFLDTGGTARGATISMDPATNITNMDIYRDTVIVRHEGLSAIAISNMDQYDFNNDPDIPFIASLGAPNSLSVFSGIELRVWTGKTFAPNGNLTVHANASTTQSRDGSVIVESGATLQAAGTESHTFGGRFTVSSGGTFTSANSSVTFNASTTGKVISPSNSSFYNLLFTGLGGGWSLGSVATATNNVTITGGAVDLPTALFAVGGNFAESATISSFTSATGSVVKFSATVSGKTIQAGTSTWASLLFHGVGGAWSFSDTNATATESITIATGTVTMPVGTFAIGADFQNTGGVFTANQSSAVKMTSTSTGTVRMGGSSLGQLLFTGGGTYSMTDTNATTTGSLRIISGTTTLPSGVLDVRQSFVNSDKFTHASGTVKMTGTTTGYSVTAGNSSFGNLELNNSGGGWTITGNATTSGTFSLLSAGAFTQTSGTTLEVRGTFTNLAGGGATTWTGTRLTILNGSVNYTINTKTQGGDLYTILRIGPSTQLRAWNSSASTYEVDTTASLYSQDHSGIDGDLYIFGNYSRTSGTDYWSYATDFDGVALGGSSRVVTVRHASGATSSFSGATLQIVGGVGATTTVTNQGSGLYTMLLSTVTLNANSFAFRNMATSGLQLLGATTLSSFQNGDLELAVAGGTLITIASTTIDQNASSFFSRMKFATTTSVTGRNVTRSGTSSAAITFQTHYGNLAGEGFDDDGSDACGQIRFDDSSCLFVDQPHFRWRNDDGGEGVPASEWYSGSWSKRKRVTITNANASAVTNASVKFSVGFDSDMQADFDDIRFTDSSGTTSLSYWFEAVNASATSTAWVKIPSLPVGETVMYIYYGNNTVASEGSGTSTFTFFDDFEDGSITDYSGDTSLFSALASMNYERTKGLGASAGNETAQTTGGIGQASLGISRDTTFRFFQYIDTSTGASDDPCFLFGMQSPISSHQNYAACLEVSGSDKLIISKNVTHNGRPPADSGATLMVTKSVTWATGWYETEVDWLSDNTIYVSVYDSAGSLFATTSTSSATYTSGGVGFSFWYQHGGWDIPTARPYTATEPSAVFGSEQTNSGASWKALIDTMLSNQLPLTNVRLRLEVKNSGTAITDQKFRLEVASKGVSPNCESVASGSYTAVPQSGSCGSAVACMKPSSQFTDQASTTDLLSVPTGTTFTPGALMEDTSNQSNNINVTNGAYTEVEYNFQITSYANASAYCFRASNAGTPLDNYSKVAEMTVLYPPTISEYHFNSDQNIALVEGATTTIYATGTVSDLNGYTDLSFATTTMYRSGLVAGRMCTAEQNNCYQVASTSCAFSSCSGNSCQFSCGADIYYFADPTDVGSPYASENWQSITDIVDTSLSRVSASSSQELYTLRGFTASNTIAYGSVTVGQNSGAYNPTTTIRNTGNSILNLLVSGTDMTNASSTIAAANQKYATSSFTYGSCVGCSTLATTSQAYNINLAKPTTTTAVSSITYWGINVPLLTAATTHSGSNTLTAN